MHTATGVNKSNCKVHCLDYVNTLNCIDWQQVHFEVMARDVCFLLHYLFSPKRYTRGSHVVNFAAGNTK